VLVSGTIGDGALGLKAHGQDRPAWVASLSEEDRACLADRYLHPRPRLALAAALQAHASAAMDVSDGLVGDLAKLLKASRADAEIDLDAVPLSHAARAAVMADPALAELAWTGGDDYEILCTVPDREYPALAAAAETAGIALAAIGRVTAGDGTVRYREQGRARVFAQGSFAHFWEKAAGVRLPRFDRRRR
jgi:thiamine-monophosphate kinase